MNNQFAGMKAKLLGISLSMVTFVVSIGAASIPSGNVPAANINAPSLSSNSIRIPTFDEQNKFGENNFFTPKTETGHYGSKNDAKIGSTVLISGANNEMQVEKKSQRKGGEWANKTRKRKEKKHKPRNVLKTVLTSVLLLFALPSQPSVVVMESGNRVTNLGDTFHCRQPPYYGSRLMPKQFECALKLDESHLKSLEESDSKFALYMDLSKEPDKMEKIAEIDVSNCKRDEGNDDDGNRKGVLCKPSKKTTIKRNQISSLDKVRVQRVLRPPNSQYEIIILHSKNEAIKSVIGGGAQLYSHNRRLLQSGQTIKIINNCSTNVWPGFQAGAGQPIPFNGGSGLLPGNGSSLIFVAPPGWTAGRIWARQGCENGMDKCTTGKCIITQRLSAAVRSPLIKSINFVLTFKNGGRCCLRDSNTNHSTNATECAGTGGEPPVSLAEFTFDITSALVSYDVSHVDGFNVPISIKPLTDANGQDKCQTIAACDLRNSTFQFPAGMVLEAGANTVVKSLCEWEDSDQVCCRKSFSTKAACNPTLWTPEQQAIYNAQHGACPHAYVYAFDDDVALFQCPINTSFAMTFC